jgi:hypothetical protein
MILATCTNEKIEIVKLTNDVIDAKCVNCGQTGHAERANYSDEEWATMQQDAKKHQNGEYAEPKRG